jgi:hypothetical protein
VQSDGALSIFGTNSFFTEGVACFLEASLPNWSQNQIRYLVMAKSTRHGADERFFVCFGFWQNCSLVLLSEKKRETFVFFLFFLDLRGTMEVSGTSNSFLFASPVAVSGGNKAIVSEAKTTLDSGGQPRPEQTILSFNH